MAVFGNGLAAVLCFLLDSFLLSFNLNINFRSLGRLPSVYAGPFAQLRFSNQLTTKLCPVLVSASPVALAFVLGREQHLQIRQNEGGY